jgi:hypothetical protein
MAKRQKQSRRKKPARRRSRKPERNRPKLKELYGPLIAYVAFANGTENSIPGKPLPKDSVIFVEAIRGEALESLRKLAAEKVKRNKRKNDIFDFLRDPPPRIAIAGRGLTDREIDRVRICPGCNKLFVALNDRAETCGANCSKIQSAKSAHDFYWENPEDERERKRGEYDRAKRLDAFVSERERRHAK